MKINPIARFYSPFKSKFGIPKQSGLVEELTGKIIFEPPFRNPNYLRGIEGFDFIWLIWEFSANPHEATSPLVRPPVLGGNEKMGVFATRSPFRPNPIGLSSVRIDQVVWESANGPVLHVKGADLMDGTPIYDIKPYIPYADCHENACSGFIDRCEQTRLQVEIPEVIASLFSAEQLLALRKTLSLDPRPHYHNNPEKIYGMSFAGYDIHFRVNENTLIVLTA